MRIFAIKDETLPADQVLGYLIYYDKAKAFYIELPENADPWDIPPILSSLFKKGERSINSYWSRMWVEERVVPADRQNIGHVLKENGLKEYDTFSLLLLSMGRCAQDDCYLEEIPLTEIPPLLLDRWQFKVEDVVPMESPNLLVFFRNGDVKVVDIGEWADSVQSLGPHLVDQNRFDKVEVQPDGYGVMWNEQAVISDRALFASGISVPLTLNDFLRFIQHRVINASEACSLLNCSRQNIDDLIRRDKLHPIRVDSKHKLFLKNEVYQRRNR